MKKLPEDAFVRKWGLSPKSQNEDGLFKYRRLPKDSYKIGIITHPNQMGDIRNIRELLMWILIKTVCRMNGKRPMV